jgi:signal transduction histidine kinase
MLFKTCYKAFIAFVLLTTAPLQASPQLSEESKRVDIAESMVWHVASLETDQLDIIAKLSAERWNSSPDNDMSLGFVDSIIWVKSEFNVEAKGHWLLNTNNSTYLDIEAWLIDPDGFFTFIGKTGLNHPFGKGKPYQVPEILFDVTFEKPGQHTMLFRIEQQGYLDFPAEFVSPDSILDIMTIESYQVGFYYGLFFCALFITLVYFIMTRDLGFLAFGFFIIGFTLFFGYVDGVLAQWFWPKTPSLSILTLHISLPIMDVGIVWFSLTFFKVPKELGLLKRWMQLLILVACLIFALTPMIGTKLVIATSLALGIIAVCSNLVLGVLLIKLYQNKIAIPFSLAWAFFGVYLLVISFSVAGLITYSVDDILDAIKLVFVLQMALLFSALAMRLRKNETEHILEKSKNQSQSQLLARVSHELRTPLNAIVGLSNMLEDHVTTKEGVQYRNLILESSNSLLNVVNNLIDSRELENNRLQLLNKPMNIKSTLASVIETYQLPIKEKELTIDFKSELPEDFKIDCDEDRFKKVINHLISNAIKFTNQGGIEITASHLLNDQVVTIEISDTGSGISKRNLTKIIRPFEQAYLENPEGLQGTGLGLFITNSLISLMGGELKIESQLNKGSTFTINLPTLIASMDDTGDHKP